MGGRGQEFKCQGECRTDWRRIWNQVVAVGRKYSCFLSDSATQTQPSSQSPVSKVKALPPLSKFRHLASISLASHAGSSINIARNAA